MLIGIDWVVINIEQSNSVDLAGGTLCLLPLSRVAQWVNGSCSSCDCALDITVFAELWSFRNCIVLSSSHGFWKVKKFKMLKTFVLLFCLSITLGEYFFVWHSFMWGISTLSWDHRGFAVLSMLKRHFNGPSLF